LGMEGMSLGLGGMGMGTDTGMGMGMGMGAGLQGNMGTGAGLQGNMGMINVAQPAMAMGQGGMLMGMSHMHPSQMTDSSSGATMSNTITGM
jgi:hypothetical protein